MALDPTARTTNIKDSVKKYFVDNVWRISKIHLTFDKAMNAPLLQGQAGVNRWLSVKIEDLQ